MTRTVKSKVEGAQHSTPGNTSSDNNLVANKSSLESKGSTCTVVLDTSADDSASFGGPNDLENDMAENLQSKFDFHQTCTNLKQENTVNKDNEKAEENKETSLEHCDNIILKECSGDEDVPNGVPDCDDCNMYNNENSTTQEEQNCTVDAGSSMREGTVILNKDLDSDDTNQQKEQICTADSGVGVHSIEVPLLVKCQAIFIDKTSRQQSESPLDEVLIQGFPNVTQVEEEAQGESVSPTNAEPLVCMNTTVDSGTCTPEEQQIVNDLPEGNLETASQLNCLNEQTDPSEQHNPTETCKFQAEEASTNSVSDLDHRNDTYQQGEQICTINTGNVPYATEGPISDKCGVTFPETSRQQSESRLEEGLVQVFPNTTGFIDNAQGEGDSQTNAKPLVFMKTTDFGACTPDECQTIKDVSEGILPYVSQQEAKCPSADSLQTEHHFDRDQGKERPDCDSLQDQRLDKENPERICLKDQTFAAYEQSKPAAISQTEEAENSEQYLHAEKQVVADQQINPKLTSQFNRFGYTYTVKHITEEDKRKVNNYHMEVASDEEVVEQLQNGNEVGKEKNDNGRKFHKSKITKILFIFSLCLLSLKDFLVCMNTAVDSGTCTPEKQQVVNIVEQLFPPEDKNLTNVKMLSNSSCHMRTYDVYAVPTWGPTYLPPDVPQDVPPNLSWPNLLERATSRAVIPERRQADHIGRNNTETSAATRVSGEPRMCMLEDGNSSTATGDNVNDEEDMYISLRDNQLAISVRLERNHSTLPLPPFRAPIVHGSNTDVPSSGTCYKVANDTLPVPAGELWDRPTLVQDGGESTRRNIAQNRDVDHDEDHNRPGRESGHSLVNLTEFTSWNNPSLQGMSDQVARAQTFRYLWPHAFLIPEQMARAGLFYTGIRDVARCFYCGNCIKDWKPGDDPAHEHRRLFPDCNFVKLHLPDGQRRNERPSAVRNEAAGMMMIVEAGEHVGSSAECIEVSPSDSRCTNTAGEDIGNRTRCPYAQLLEEEGRRLQLMNRRYDLDPHAEQERNTHHRNGTETAWGGSNETSVRAVDSLEPAAVQDIGYPQHVNDGTPEAISTEESANSQQQRTAARVIPGSHIRQPVSDNQAPGRSPVQQHGSGMVSTKSLRNPVNHPPPNRLTGNGTETAWGGSNETSVRAVDSLEPAAVQDIGYPQHVNDGTPEAISTEERANSQQQRTAARVIPGSHIRQPVSDNQAPQRSPVQQHGSGMVSTRRSLRNPVNHPSPYRLTGQGLERNRIEDFLGSEEGRLLLYEGYYRTDVAHAIRTVLQGNGRLTFHTVLEALVYMHARRTCRPKAKPF